MINSAAERNTFLPRSESGGNIAFQPTFQSQGRPPKTKPRPASNTTAPIALPMASCCCGSLGVGATTAGVSATDMVLPYLAVSYKRLTAERAGDSECQGDLPREARGQAGAERVERSTCRFG